MKVFFYKSIIVVFLFLITFHFSFNYAYKKIANILNDTFSKDKIESVKNKLRSEAKVAINKDVYINSEDAELINKFLNKIKSDLKKIINNSREFKKIIVIPVFNDWKSLNKLLKKIDTNLKKNLMKFSF